MKIMAVSLEGSQKFKAYAIYKDGLVAITHCLPISGKPSAWGPDLKKEIYGKSKDGFIVLVEDRSGTMLSGDASQFNFEDIEEGRSMLFHSLDWFFSMREMGRVVAAPEIERHMIRSGGEGQKVERTQDERGRTIYKVDWDSIGGGTKAILMCVVASQMPPMTEKYFSDFYGALDSDVEEKDPLSSFYSITTGVDEARIRQMDKLYEK